MKTIYFIIIAGIIFTSCIPNKNLLYLKSDNFSDSTFIENKVVDYKLRPDDILMIEIKGLDPQTAPLFDAISSKAQGNSGGANGASLALQGHTIDIDGNINLPLIGKVKLAGVSISEVTQTIQGEVDQYFINATVKVNLVSFRVTVLGEVKRPGVYYNYNKRLSILETLGMAGDLTSFGDRKKILLLRQQEKGEKVVYLDLSKLDLISSDYFYLIPGDVIYVQPMRAGTQRFNFPVVGIIFSSISTLILTIRFLTL